MKIKFLISILIILYVYNSCDLMSQDIPYLLIKGNVISKNPLNIYSLKDGAIIEVIQNNVRTQKIITDKNGNFEIKLPYQNEYIIEISKQGLIKKIFVINTIVPSSYNFRKQSTYKFSVSIFPIIEDIDLSIFESPIARISYYSEKEGFFFNYDEARQINFQVKEIENMVLVTILLKEKNYKNCIKFGNISFNIKSYEKALMYFTEASGIYPEEKYPKQKVSEIYKILINEKDYQYTIQISDNLFNLGKYQKAKDGYIKALILKPTDQYPALRIIEINKIINKMFSDSLFFRAIISDADSMFVRKQYIEALKNYQKTLSIIPNFEHSIRRIYTIDSLLKKTVDNLDGLKKQIQTNDNFNNKDLDSAQYTFLNTYDTVSRNKDSKFESLIESQTQINSNYNSLLSNAINCIHANEYEKAIEIYELLLKDNPDNKNVIEKITLLKNIIFTIKNQKKESYEKYSDIGNSLFVAGMFENAVKNYELALTFKHDDKYLIERIEKVKEIIKESITILVLQNANMINNNQEFKIHFERIKHYNKNNDYIKIVLVKNEDKDFKIIMNFGNDNVKNGGIVFSTDSKKEIETIYNIKIGQSKSWTNIDNNWISFLPLGGDIKLMNVILFIDK